MERKLDVLQRARDENRREMQQRIHEQLEHNLEARQRQEERFAQQLEEERAGHAAELRAARAEAEAARAEAEAARAEAEKVSK